MHAKSFIVSGIRLFVARLSVIVKIVHRVHTFHGYENLYPEARIGRPHPAGAGIHPIAALIGPRQCGKTTLAHQIAETQPSEFFDLEHPVSLERLANPLTTLEPLQGLVVLDEVQRKPELFPILRVLADRKNVPAKFLLLGSASPDLIRGSSETLAGRIAFIDMAGFDLAEVGESALRRLWFRGGFPRSFLAAHDEESREWRMNFIQTFLEREIRMFGGNRQ
jgi:predicted AAA+ superfamily ATPase